MLAVLLGSKTPVSAKSVITKLWNDNTLPYHTSIDIKASDIYSMSAGYVLFIGRDNNNLYSVSILVNSTKMIRYCNLDKVHVSSGSNVSKGQRIGHVKDVVKLEYCTNYAGNSKWAVRIFGTTFYKQNPMGILTGNEQLHSYTDSVHVVDNNVERNELTDEEHNEYANSRGIINVEF